MRWGEDSVQAVRDIACNDQARHEEHGPPIISWPVAICLLQLRVEIDASTQSRSHTRTADIPCSPFQTNNEPTSLHRCRNALSLSFDQRLANQMDVPGFEVHLLSGVSSMDPVHCKRSRRSELCFCDSLLRANASCACLTVSRSSVVPPWASNSHTCRPSKLFKDLR
jgi:hypothetical protein